MIIEEIKIYGIGRDMIDDDLECESDKKDVSVLCKRSEEGFEYNSVIVIN